MSGRARSPLRGRGDQPVGDRPRLNRSSSWLPREVVVYGETARLVVHDAVSMTLPRFGPKEQRKANDSQLLTFFRGYDSTWRVSKILMIRSLLRDREKVRADLQAAGLRNVDEAHVYGPLTNGLVFSAVAALMMLVEDLLALVMFIRSRCKFAESLAHYRAGKVTNLAETLHGASDERILSAFMVPPLVEVEASRGSTDLEQLRQVYGEGTSSLVRKVHAVLSAYKRFE